jgi:uncharacterized tellurite resistance protein B-like protein
MEGNNSILEGHSDIEKTAYLGTIASIATADRQATEEELSYISGLCEAAGLSSNQSATVQNAAADVSGSELTKNLDVLKNSNLKFSLIADLMTFAKSDNDYREEENESIHKIAEYLGVDQHQFSLLDQVADKASNSDIETTQNNPQNILNTSGIKDKLENAGINSNSLLKGLVSIAAPIILSRIFSRGMSSSGSTGGLGGALGGALGGNLGGLLGGGGGGLGSLIGMLSGGRGMGSAGGLLSRILGGGGF